MKMTQAISTGIILSPLTAGPGFSATEIAPKRPRLILAIAVDQFRADYTTRFRSE